MAIDPGTAELLVAIAEGRLVFWGVDCLECGDANPNDSRCDNDSTHSDLAPLFIVLATKPNAAPIRMKADFGPVAS